MSDDVIESSILAELSKAEPAPAEKIDLPLGRANFTVPLSGLYLLKLASDPILRIEPFLGNSLLFLVVLALVYM